MDSVFLETDPVVLETNPVVLKSRQSFARVGSGCGPSRPGSATLKPQDLPADLVRLPYWILSNISLNHLNIRQSWIKVLDNHSREGNVKDWTKITFSETHELTETAKLGEH